MKKLKIKEKVKIQMPSNVYQGTNICLQNLATFRLDCNSYFYEMQKFHCTKLAKSKFNKMLHLGENEVSLSLNLQEAVTLYYCFALEKVYIGSNMDVYQFMIDFLSSEAIQNLDEEIKKIYPYWQKVKMAQMQGAYVENIKQEADLLIEQNKQDYE